MEVTLNADHTVLPDAAEALRKAVPPVGLALLRSGHEDAVTSVAFSPDGKRIATSGLDNKIRIWDASSGEEMLSFVAQCELEPGLIFSRDGKRLACANVAAAIVWDAATGRDLLTVRNFCWGHAVDEFTFSSDGSLLAAGCNNGKIWVGSVPSQPQASAETKTLPELDGHHLIFSPDGKRLAAIAGKPVSNADQSLSEGSVAKIWDTATGAELLTIRHSGTINDLAFSPDGRRLITCTDLEATTWDASSGNALLRLNQFIHVPVSAVAFSPHGNRLATLSGSKKWSDEARSFVDAQLPTSGTIWDSVSGRRLSIKSWPVLTPARAFFTPDGERLVAIGKGSAKSQVAFQSTNKLANNLEGLAGKAVIWNTGKTATPDSFAISAAFAFSSDGKRLAIADGKSVDIQTADRSQTLFTLLGRDEQLCTAVFAPGGERLATTGSDRTVRVWDTANGHRLLTLFGHKAQVGSLAYSPDGKLLASASRDGTARVWDAASGQPKYVLSNPAGAKLPVPGVAFIPDGKRLVTDNYASLSSGTVALWDAESGRPLHSFSPGHWVRGVTFSADGTRLIARFDMTGKLEVWDVDSGKSLPDESEQIASWNWIVASHLVGFAGSVEIPFGNGPACSLTMSFTKDGRWLATPFADNPASSEVGERTAEVLDLRSGMALPLFGQGAHVRSVGFSPNENHLYAVDDHWEIYKHPLRMEDLTAEARRRCSQFSPSLASFACRQYLHLEKCPPVVIPEHQ